MRVAHCEITWRTASLAHGARDIGVLCDIVGANTWVIDAYEVLKHTIFATLIRSELLFGIPDLARVWQAIGSGTRSNRIILIKALLLDSELHLFTLVDLPFFDALCDRFSDLFTSVVTWAGRIKAKRLSLISPLW